MAQLPTLNGRNRLLGSALVALTLLLPGLAPAAEINLAPIFKLDTQTGRGAALGPLLEFGPDEFAVRPLVYHDQQRTDLLFPLASLKPDRGYVFPLMTYRRDAEQRRWSFLPVFRGQNGDKTYGGVFPFYGHFEKRFGYDEVDFALWPLYSRSVRDGQKTYTVLWPFFRYSPERELKFWPLYGQETSADSTYRYFLWPLVHEKRSETEDIDAVLPLYWYERSPNSKSVAVLWPLMRYSRNEDRQHVSADAPWPLVRYAEGAYHERRYLPFYWEKDLGDKYRMRAILWPLYRERESRSDQGYSRQVNVMVLSGSSLSYSSDGQVSKSLSVWPFWHSEINDGVTSWQVPYLLPFKNEGYRRTWEPLFTLASGSYSEDASQTDVLWHTLQYERKNDEQNFKFSFVVEVDKNAEETRFKFMSGLIAPPALKQSDEEPNNKESLGRLPE